MGDHLDPDDDYPNHLVALAWSSRPGPAEAGAMADAAGGFLERLERALAELRHWTGLLLDDNPRDRIACERFLLLRAARARRQIQSKHGLLL